jgi:hypothetical protein
MSDRKDLPFLLQLLEDDSPVVRNEVEAALLSFGPDLEGEVQPYLYNLEAESLMVLEDLICQFQPVSEKDDTWMEWLDIVNPKQSLEYAMIQLAFQEYGAEAFLLGEDLDLLAERFEEQYPEGRAKDLMEFLFQEERFRSPVEGTDCHLYDNLIYVLKTRRGSQIALSCLAILVGWRAGIDLEGISIQGNFMAMAYEDKNMQMYNSFNQGKPLARASVMYIEEAFRRNQIPPNEMKAEVHEIVLQILKNTMEFNQINNEPISAAYTEMYQALMDELKDRGLTGA